MAVDPDELRDRLRAERDGTLNELIDRQAQVEAAARERARQPVGPIGSPQCLSISWQNSFETKVGAELAFSLLNIPRTTHPCHANSSEDLRRSGPRRPNQKVAGWEIGVDECVNPGVPSDGPEAEPRIIVLLATGYLARSVRPGVFAKRQPGREDKNCR